MSVDLAAWLAAGLAFGGKDVTVPSGMRPRSPKPGSRKALTLVALAFAVGSIVWSIGSIRQWMVEMKENRPSEARSRRGREPEPREELAPTPTNALAALASRRSTAAITNGASLFDTTNIWTVHLRFTPAEWADIEPRQIEPLEQSGGGRFELRNPGAKRNGLAGVRGIEFEWVHATVEFEDRTFADAAVRYKGNGTYLRSQRMAKRPFKVDLNKFTKTNSLAGRTTLNFANMVTDDSCLHDVLGYELYRAAGVPSPRTAYARLFVTIGATPPTYLGLYAVVENVDESFAAERFGTRQGVLFKPVTMDLFADLGDNWAAYDGIYDPKGKLTAAQSERVIEFAKLLGHANNATFAARVGEFLELDEFARFLATTVLLSSYDGFLNNGQNFYLWLSPDTHKFQFIPWDLDNAWGKFGAAGSVSDRAHASIMHPWMSSHRLLERVMAVPEFKSLYQRTLQDLLTRIFVPERLNLRVDELARLLRPVVVEESPRKSSRFAQAVDATSLGDSANEGPGFGRNRAPHPLKWFISERAESVRAQLAGENSGVRLERWR
ncbi:MAG TPA: CotH kinase family protein [Verrucomicrobiota bacterium]|nr:hypothetical protein [Verrucomicrobiales bacterium]HRI15673.1 CotH kinase family protein [Verrucomicrobiota bacterium]